jgi:hypothetical protein
VDPSFWVPLALKMLITAAIVVTASKIVERSGPFLGAMVATLPMTAGPAFAFLAMESSAEFIAESALAGLSVMPATIVYMLVYATIARRRGVFVSIGVAYAVWVVLVSIILQWQWTLGGALALNGVVFAVSLIHARTLTGTAAPPRLPKRPWDVPFRAALVMLVVGGMVLGGRALGPAFVGTAAMAPVVLMCLALILHPRIGGVGTASVMANGIPGMLGFAGALCVLHLSAAPLSIVPALILALATSLCWNATLVAVRSRRLQMRKF